MVEAAREAGAREVVTAAEEMEAEAAAAKAALHFPAPEQRPWLQVFPLVVQTESFLHQSGKKVSKSSLLVLALTVRLQSYPFCSSAPRSLARPDLDKIDSWSSRMPAD